MKFKDLSNRDNVDLHVHTKYSDDSFMSPEKIVRFAEKYKKIIAITDHNEIAGALEAKKYDKENRIIVGEEIMAMDIGREILAYGIQRKIEPGGAMDIVREIHSQGGMAVLPHPFRRGYLLRIKCPVYPDDVIQAVDGVEVFNARNSQKENTKALLFADKHGKIKIKGSDAHMMWELHIANYNFILLNLFKNILTLLTKLIKKIPSIYDIL
jgi:predicted metal-dependent phosphoesterase TrpH